MLIVGIGALRVIPLYHDFDQNRPLSNPVYAIFNPHCDSSTQGVCAISAEDDSNEDEILTLIVFKNFPYPFSLYDVKCLSHPVTYQCWETLYDSIKYSNDNMLFTSLPLRSPPYCFI
jgi:hypothetical protein